MAARISSSVAGLSAPRPRARFSATDIENSVGSSNAVATAVRRAGSDSSRMSRPSSRIAPSVTSYSRENNAARTDFPEPVAPTRANVCPGSTVTDTWRSAQSSGAASGNRKPTSRNSRCPPRGTVVTGPSVISTGASKISATRSAAVMDSCIIDSRKPSDAMGHTSDSIMVMNATSVPMVTRSWPTAYAPNPSTRMSVRFGMTSSSVQNRADTATLPTSAS